MDAFAYIEHSLVLCKTEGDIIDLIHSILESKCMPQVHYILDRTFPLPSHVIYEFMLRHKYGQKTKLALWKRYVQQVETIIIDSFLSLQDNVEPLHKQIYAASKKIISKMNIDKYANSTDPCELRFFICHSKNFYEVIRVLRNSSKELKCDLPTLKPYLLSNIIDRRCMLRSNIVVSNEYLCKLVGELFDNKEFHVLDIIKCIHMGPDVSDICLEKIFEHDLPELLVMTHKHFSEIIIRAYLEKKWRLLLYAIEFTSNDLIESLASNLQESTRIDFYDRISNYGPI